MNKMNTQKMHWKILDVYDLEKDLLSVTNNSGTNKQSDYIKYICDKCIYQQDWIAKGFLNVSQICQQIILEFNTRSSQGVRYLHMSSQMLDEHHINFALRMCIGDIVKKVAGKNGHYFKMTTEAQQAIFIWHSAPEDRIYVWGDKRSIINSLNIIHSRFYKAIYELWPKIVSFNTYNLQREMDEVIFENEFIQSAKLLNQLDEEVHPFSDLNTYLNEDLDIDYLNWKFEKDNKATRWGCNSRVMELLLKSANRSKSYSDMNTEERESWNSVYDQMYC